MQTGLDIDTVLPKNFEEFEWAIKNGDIDFAFQDPNTYVYLSRLYNKDALIGALTMNGDTYQHGLIIAMEGSGINKVGDLRGKTVMFGPKFSATKWIAAKEVFEENGININKDLRAYLNGGCCEDIAFNVYLRAVDAGVVCDHFLDVHSEKQKELGINVKQIITIGRTGPVPTKVFAARKELDSSVVAKINQALLSLDKKIPAHAEILYPAELGGFQKSMDKDYDGMRILMDWKQ
jgi:phosphonate transport system substrate-binding protein